MTTPEQKLIDESRRQWDGVDRRGHNRGLLFDMIAEVTDKIDKHIEDSAEWREMLAAKMKGDEHLMQQILGGFPNDDPRGHKEYHESVIAAAKARREFWIGLAKELAKYGLIGFVGWAFVALWAALLKGPK